MRKTDKQAETYPVKVFLQYALKVQQEVASLEERLETLTARAEKVTSVLSATKVQNSGAQYKDDVWAELSDTISLYEKLLLKQLRLENSYELMMSMFPKEAIRERTFFRLKYLEGMTQMQMAAWTGLCKAQIEKLNTAILVEAQKIYDSQEWQKVSKIQEIGW